MDSHAPLGQVHCMLILKKPSSSSLIIENYMLLSEGSLVYSRAPSTTTLRERNGTGAGGNRGKEKKSAKQNDTRSSHIALIVPKAAQNALRWACPWPGVTARCPAPSVATRASATHSDSTPERKGRANRRAAWQSIPGARAGRMYDAPLRGSLDHVNAPWG